MSLPAKEPVVENEQIRAYNQAAWDRNVEQSNRWTIPVSPEAVAAARRGKLDLLLTPSKTVPADWYPPLNGLPVLCLASGGGQQGPLLAAAAAKVTVFDNSPRQLAQDRLVAEREGLALETAQGDTADLSKFSGATFGLIFHPCSNCFMPSVPPIWRECYRVLRPGGILLAGFCNPFRYIFDVEAMDAGRLEVRHSIPYSDAESLDDGECQRLVFDKLQPLEFGHTLADQIGGQLDAGFVLTGFYEDGYVGPEGDPLSNFLDSFIATRAVKPAP